MSEPMRVTSGVPHGSILCPLLFIIFINNLLLVVENCNLDMYADDSMLEDSGKTVDQLEHKLASYMVIVEHWCFLNKMVINITKTTTMLITTYQKLHKLLVKNINITVNNQAIESVTSKMLLDVVVDQNLTWKGHVDKVNRTVRMLLSKLWCIKPMIFDLPIQTPTKSRLEKLNWMSVMDRVEYRWAIMTIQVLKWNSPRLYEGNVQICNRYQPETDQICK